MPWRSSILVAGFFLFAGAVFGGTEGLKNVGALVLPEKNHVVLFYVSSGLAMVVLNSLGFLVSASQVVVGSVLGLMSATLRFQVRDLLYFSKVFFSWCVTPVVAALLGNLFYRLFSQRAKGIKRVQRQEMLIRILATIGIAYSSYSFGANNVANVTGILVGKGLDMGKASIIGGASIVLGMLCHGKRSAVRAGRSVLELDHITSLASIFSQAVTVWFFSSIGVPVSSSQAIIGGVLGAGRARGVRLESRKVLFRILVSWLLTPLTSGLLSFVLMKILIRFW